MGYVLIAIGALLGLLIGRALTRDRPPAAQTGPILVLIDGFPHYI